MNIQYGIASTVTIRIILPNVVDDILGLEVIDDPGDDGDNARRVVALSPQWVQVRYVEISKQKITEKIWYKIILKTQDNENYSANRHK